MKFDRKIKPRIRVVKIEQKTLPYYSATLTLEPFQLTCCAMNPAQALSRVLIRGKDEIDKMSFGGDFLYGDLGQYIKQKQQILRMELELKSFQREIDSSIRMTKPSPMKDHHKATSNLPWWKRIFRV